MKFVTKLLRTTYECGIAGRLAIYKGINMRNSMIRKIKYTYFRTSAVMLFFGALALPSLRLLEHTGDNMFDVYLNGVPVGQAADEETAESCMIKARYAVSAESDELVFMKTELSLEGREVMIGEVSREEDIVNLMKDVMEGSREETMQQAYTVKINDFTVNLASMDEVQQLLQAAVDKYDSTDSYGVEMVQDADRELNVLTTRVYSEIEAKEEENQEERAKADASSLFSTGIFAVFQEAADAVEIEEEKDLSEYNRGLIHMNFGDTIEVVESYMPESHLSRLEDAIEEVTKDQETNKIYEVVAGDTLGEIA